MKHGQAGNRKHLGSLRGCLFSCFSLFVGNSLPAEQTYDTHHAYSYMRDRLIHSCRNEVVLDSISKQADYIYIQLTTSLCYHCIRRNRGMNATTTEHPPNT